MGRLGEVPAVAVEHFTARALGGQCLVGEIPNETTLVKGVLVGELRVAFHRTERVPHRMRVLTQDERLVAARLQELFNLRGWRVHSTIHVTGVRVAVVPKEALVVNGPGVNFPEIVGDMQQVFTAERLVSHRPHHHRRVVLVPLNHVRSPVQQQWDPPRIIPR